MGGMDVPRADDVAAEEASLMSAAEYAQFLADEAK